MFADVEGFYAHRETHRDGVLDSSFRDLIVVNFQLAGAPLSDAAAIVLKVEYDCVFAD